MSANRFDPEPGMPHAVCDDCSMVLADRVATNRHMQATIDKATGRSHTVTIENRSRQERVDHWIGELADPWSRIIPEIRAAIERGELTEEEATKAIGKTNPYDLRDEWRNATIESEQSA